MRAVWCSVCELIPLLSTKREKATTATTTMAAMTATSTIFFIHQVKLFSFRMAQFADPANKSLPFLPFSLYLITFYGFFLSTFASASVRTCDRIQAFTTHTERKRDNPKRVAMSFPEHKTRECILSKRKHFVYHKRQFHTHTFACTYVSVLKSVRHN